MVKLEFKDLEFFDKKDEIRVSFLKIYYFDIQKKDLEAIDEYEIGKNYIIFKNISEKKAWNKFDKVLSWGFNNLFNKVSGNKTIYIHRNSGIPLIGSNSFGLVDRDTNLIEIKPITGCNLNCIFCSVDEGKDTKKKLDFIVEKDYLVEEFGKLAKEKGADPLYAYVNVHGEPLLYSPIVELIRDLKKFPNVITGIITNGTLLNEKMIDDLKEAGLDRINISLNAFSKEKTKKLAGGVYNFDRIIEIIKYVNEKIELVIAPLYLSGLNDDDMEEIIKFVISIRKNGFPLLGIQNFLSYKLGRNPVKQLPWEDFNDKIKVWEEKYGIDLKGDENFYNIFKTKKLSKPFRKGEIVKAEIISQDRYPGQCIASSKERVISVLNCYKSKGHIKVKIIRDKHNIFVGTLD